MIVRRYLFWCILLFWVTPSNGLKRGKTRSLSCILTKFILVIGKYYLSGDTRLHYFGLLNLSPGGFKSEKRNEDWSETVCWPPAMPRGCYIQVVKDGLLSTLWWSQSVESVLNFYAFSLSRFQIGHLNLIPIIKLNGFLHCSCPGPHPVDADHWHWAAAIVHSL